MSELINLSKNKETGFFKAHVAGNGHELIIEETKDGYSIVSLKGELTSADAKPFIEAMDGLRKYFNEVEQKDLTTETKAVESPIQTDASNSQTS